MYCKLLPASVPYCDDRSRNTVQRYSHLRFLHPLGTHMPGIITDAAAELCLLRGFPVGLFVASILPGCHCTCCILLITTVLGLLRVTELHRLVSVLGTLGAHADDRTLDHPNNSSMNEDDVHITRTEGAAANKWHLTQVASQRPRKGIQVLYALLLCRKPSDKAYMADYSLYASTASLYASTA